MFGSTLTFTASILAAALAAPVPFNAVTPKTLAARGNYIMFGGDGTMDAGWPTRKQWMPFEQAW